MTLCSSSTRTRVHRIYLRLAKDPRAEKVSVHTPTHSQHPPSEPQKVPGAVCFLSHALSVRHSKCAHNFAHYRRNERLMARLSVWTELSESAASYSGESSERNVSTICHGLPLDFRRFRLKEFVASTYNRIDKVWFVFVEMFE